MGSGRQRKEAGTRASRAWEERLTRGARWQAGGSGRARAEVAAWARGVTDGPRGESDRAGPGGKERRGKMAWAGSSLGWAEVLGWGKGKGRRPGWAARGKRKLGSAGLLGWIHFFFFFLYFLFLFLTQTQAK